MPQLGTAEINGKLRRVVYCSRDSKCMFWAKGADEVREHEKEVHPRPQDNEPPFDLSTIRPQLRRK